jgi:hypothetical protein
LELELELDFCSGFKTVVGSLFVPSLLTLEQTFDRILKTKVPGYREIADFENEKKRRKVSAT